MRNSLIVLTVIGLTAGAAGQTPPPDKIDVVAVSGCLKEPAPNTWMLTSATDPTPSNANSPLPKELAAMPRTGKNEYRLIGVTEFNLPAHRDHTVVIKALLIKAMPVSRLNITSVTMVAPTCPPPDPK
jgi:hypothetical protein